MLIYSYREDGEFWDGPDFGCVNHEGVKMKVQVHKLNENALNYLMAKDNGHEWRYPWLLEQDGFKAWVSSERSWGNMHPDYVNGEFVLHTLEKIDCIRKRSKAEEATLENPNPNFKFKAEISGDVKGFYCAFGSTMIIAALRCYLLFKMGEFIEVPDQLIENNSLQNC